MRRARIHFKRKEKRKTQRGGGWELARECSLVETGRACDFVETGASVPVRTH